MKIFLLEDNERLNRTIVKKFKSSGFDIDSFLDGDEAIDSVNSQYDCFVLDINVPSIGGLEILKYVKDRYPKTPVLIISSTIELESIKEAYTLGCEDYIKKPFYIDELELKIKKLCKSEEIELSESIKYNPNSRELFLDGHSQKFTKKELLLVHLLITNQDRVITIEEIEDYVWGDSVSLDCIRSLVMKVRKKLPNIYIETIIDVGYKLKLN